MGLFFRSTSVSMKVNFLNLKTSTDPYIGSFIKNGQTDNAERIRSKLIRFIGVLLYLINKQADIMTHREEIFGIPIYN